MLLLLTLVFASLRTLYTYRNLAIDSLDDFYVYDTAAALVRQHAGVAIYTGADRGVDPQFLFQEPASRFAAEARDLGIPAVRMYVYPPLLADLLVPLSWMEAHRAGRVWLILNAAALLLSAALLTKLSQAPFFGTTGLAITVGVLAMFPVALAVESGQITVLLLLLWVIGMYAYRRGQLALSATAIALAACIKLTPLLAVLPMLAWRDWRWLRAFAVAVGLLLGVMLVVNGPAPLLDYFLHVMPAMSRGVPHLENRSIAAALQILYSALHGGHVVALQATGVVPHWILELGKAVPAGVALLAVGWPATRKPSLDGRVLARAAFALLSVVAAPVSWFHAFVVGYPLLVLLWGLALRQAWPRWHVVLLVVCSVDLSTALLNGVRQRTSNDVAAALLAFGAPLVSLALVWLGLRHIQELGTSSERSANRTPDNGDTERLIRSSDLSSRITAGRDLSRGVRQN